MPTAWGTIGVRKQYKATASNSAISGKGIIPLRDRFSVEKGLDGDPPGRVLPGKPNIVEAVVRRTTVMSDSLWDSNAT